MIDLEKEMLTVSLKLYGDTTIPRKVTQSFINILIDFTTNTFVSFIKEQIICKPNSEKCYNLEEIVKYYKTVFDLFSTEHKVFALYRKRNRFNIPIEYSLGTKYVQDSGNYSTIANKATMTYIPLKWSLKILLEMPGAFEIMTNYINELNSDSTFITNVNRADLWKKI